MIERTEKTVNPKDVVCVSSNYFSESCENMTDKALEDGLWVMFCADCIGHTRAKIFECSGEKYIADKYGEYWLEAAKNDWGHTCFRLR